MTKAQLTALIKAIEQSVIFIVQNGIAIRNAIANAEADKDYVDGLVEDYDGEISDIIDDIPDDPADDVTPADGGDDVPPADGGE